MRQTYKSCLEKTLGNAKLTYEELETALIEVEGLSVESRYRTSDFGQTVREYSVLNGK